MSRFQPQTGRMEKADRIALIRAISLARAGSMAYKPVPLKPVEAKPRGHVSHYGWPQAGSGDLDRLPVFVCRPRPAVAPRAKLSRKRRANPLTKIAEKWEKRRLPVLPLNHPSKATMKLDEVPNEYDKCRNDGTGRKYGGNRAPSERQPGASGVQRKRPNRQTK
jgi:hypothetical protein